MFYEYQLSELDPDADYFYNIVVVEIHIPFGSEQVIPRELTAAWDVSRITQPRPIVYYIMRDASLRLGDGEIEDETSYEVNPHCVVAIRKNGQIVWYEMIDFFTEDMWKIDPEVEEEI